MVRLLADPGQQQRHAWTASRKAQGAVAAPRRCTGRRQRWQIRRRYRRLSLAEGGASRSSTGGPSPAAPQARIGRRRALATHPPGGEDGVGKFTAPPCASPPPRSGCSATAHPAAECAARPLPHRPAAAGRGRSRRASSRRRRSCQRAARGQGPHKESAQIPIGGVVRIGTCGQVEGSSFHAHAGHRPGGAARCGRNAAADRRPARSSAATANGQPPALATRCGDVLVAAVEQCAPSGVKAVAEHLPGRGESRRLRRRRPNDGGGGQQGPPRQPRAAVSGLRPSFRCGMLCCPAHSWRIAHTHGRKDATSAGAMPAPFPWAAGAGPGAGRLCRPDGDAKPRANHRPRPRPPRRGAGYDLPTAELVTPAHPAHNFFVIFAAVPGNEGGVRCDGSMSRMCWVGPCWWRSACGMPPTPLANTPMAPPAAWGRAISPTWVGFLMAGLGAAIALMGVLRRGDAAHATAAAARYQRRRLRLRRHRREFRPGAGGVRPCRAHHPCRTPLPAAAHPAARRCAVGARRRHFLSGPWHSLHPFRWGA